MLVLEIEVADVGWNERQWRITVQEQKFHDMRGEVIVIFSGMSFTCNSVESPEFYADGDNDYCLYMRGHDTSTDKDWISFLYQDDLDKLLSALRLLTNKLYNSSNKEIEVDGNFYRFYI